MGQRLSLLDELLLQEDWPRAARHELTQLRSMNSRLHMINVSRRRFGDTAASPLDEQFTELLDEMGLTVDALPHTDMCVQRILTAWGHEPDDPGSA